MIRRVLIALGLVARPAPLHLVDADDEERLDAARLEALAELERLDELTNIGKRNQALLELGSDLREQTSVRRQRRALDAFDDG